ncbi:MAG: hypothetical protein ACTS78_00830 [Arsenophonus sp. NC-WZS1-MAG3]
MHHNITVNVTISLVAMAYNGSSSTLTYTCKCNEQGPIDASNENC